LLCVITVFLLGCSNTERDSNSIDYYGIYEWSVVARGEQPTPSPSPTPEPVLDTLWFPIFPALTDIESTVCSLPWPCSVALYYMYRESGGEPWKMNYSGSGACGLFQIHPIHAGKWPDFWARCTEVGWNVEKAFELWKEQGWYPWR